MRYLLRFHFYNIIQRGKQTRIMAVDNMSWAEPVHLHAHT